MRSISFKLIAAFLAVSLVGAAIAVVLAQMFTRSEFDRFVIDRSRNEFVDTLTLYYETNGSWDGIQFAIRTGPKGHGQGQGPGMMMQDPLPFLLVDPQGYALIPAGSYQVGDLVNSQALTAGEPITVNNIEVARLLTIGNTPQLDTRDYQYLQRIIRAIILAGASAAALALLLGIFLARSISRPLTELTTALQGFSKGKQKQHVPVRSKDELGQLAAAFNQMSDELEHSTQLRRQMTAEVAHDLRTPLTVMKGYLESMREGVLKPTPERLNTLYDEANHLTRLVNDLHTLSIADAGELSLSLQPIAAGELLERAASLYQHEAEQKQISIQTSIAQDLPQVQVDSDRMLQVLGNLISNALRYTPDGGQILLKTYCTGRDVAIDIIDNGSGIPPEIQQNIFERLFRGDMDGQHSGLGLAIARSIVEMHNGSITAVSDGPGKGSRFTIHLPAVQ